MYIIFSGIAVKRKRDLLHAIHLFHEKRPPTPIRYDDTFGSTYNFRFKFSCREMSFDPRLGAHSEWDRITHVIVCTVSKPTKLTVVKPCFFFFIDFFTFNSSSRGQSILGRNFTNQLTTHSGPKRKFNRSNSNFWIIISNTYFTMLPYSIQRI